MELETKDERSYVSYDNRTVYHSCERMSSDSWEAGFCHEDLFYVCAETSLERGSRNYYGYTYACSRHLRSVALALCVTLEDRSLDEQYDIWTDEQHEAAQADLSRDQAEDPGTVLEESGS